MDNQATDCTPPCYWEKAMVQTEFHQGVAGEIPGSGTEKLEWEQASWPPAVAATQQD